MAERYIQHRRSSPRQYTRGCPVVLAAAALLEDTQCPRLVAQIKFTSLSARLISALHISVHCFDAGEADASTVAFQYHNLRVRRGQSFGQYTAIVLPKSDIARFSITVDRVVFADGSSWFVPEDAKWGILPAFTPLTSGLTDPQLRALSRRALPKAFFAYEAPGDLWYCSCGGVNHDAETVCHRCRAERSVVAQFASPVQLAALYESRQAEAVQRDRARVAAETREKETREKETKGPPPGPVRRVAVQRKQNVGRGKWMALGGVAAAAIIGGCFLLPKLASEAPGGKEPPQSTVSDRAEPGEPSGRPAPTTSGSAEPPEPSQKPEPVEPDDRFPSTEESVFINVTADQWGACTVDSALIQAQIPETKYINFFGVPALGDQLDNYLLDSFQMSMLMCDGTSQGEWAKFTPKNEAKSTFCLLVFDDAAHLIGYFVGIPEKVNDDTWRFRVSLCDYDFSALYEEQKAALQAGKDELYKTYIPLADVASSGVAYCLQGYYTGRSSDPREDVCQMYHLWSELNSPHLKQFARGLDRIDQKEPREGRYLFFLLLDQDYKLIGYTMVGNG